MYPGSSPASSRAHSKPARSISGVTTTISTPPYREESRNSVSFVKYIIPPPWEDEEGFDCLRAHTRHDGRVAGAALLPFEAGERAAIGPDARIPSLRARDINSLGG